MGDVYMLNGKILSGLPNHAKDIEFDNTETPLSSTNTEDAIKEVNSNLSSNDFGTRISISAYNSISNPFTAPSDGYLQASCQGLRNTYAFIKLLTQTLAETGVNLVVSGGDNTDLYATVTTTAFVRKGTKVYCGGVDVGVSTFHYFLPLI